MVCDCLFTRLMRDLDDQAQSAPEHTALRWIWARHVNYGSTLFEGCRTQAQLLAVLSDGPRLLQEPWVGPRSVQHLRTLVARAVTLEES